MGKTIVSTDGKFEWGEDKNAENKMKHGFEFHEILSVFDDPYALERYDWKNSTFDKERFVGIGRFDNKLVLLFCYTERVERTRVYSARVAEPFEEALYYEHYANAVG